MKSNLLKRAIATLATLAILPQIAPAHGTVSDPISRVYSIYQEGPDSPDTPAAQAAIAVAGPSAYYTWNQISQNVANYADSTFDTTYASVIPDGKLASGNNVGPDGLNFSGLDLVSNDWDWPATNFTAGVHTINWLATAPHDPSFFKVWITKADYNHKTPLTWDKLEFLGKFNNTQYTKTGLNYSFPVTIPQRSGRHVLYVAWQRIDPVGEVFFSASDINFDGNGNTDPEADPVISLTPVTINENIGTTNITATLNKPVPVGSTATVNYTTTNGSATQPQDYTTSSGTLTFAPGETTKTFPVAITNDSTPESPENFSINLSTPSGLTIGTPSTTITINDDDLSSESGYDFAKRDDWGAGYNGWLSITNGSTPISNGTIIISVPSGQTLSTYGGPTATDNEDGTYTISNINIAANETIRLDLGFGNATGGSRGPTSITLNGSPLGSLPPSVSVESIEKQEGDTPDSVSLTVTLSRAHTSSIHVAYQTLDGTATAPDDYTSTSGTLVFTAGQTTKTILIPHNANTTSEPDKSFSLTLSGANGETPPRFATSADNTALITLIDDDGGINLTATGSTVIEPDTGSTNLTFRLLLDRPVKTGETVSIDYATHGHGATPGTDFTPTSGTYTFAEGSTSGTIQVPILGDTIDERHEWLNLHFTTPVGINLVTHAVTGQIIDNEFSAAKLGKQRVVAYLDATSGSLNIPAADRVTHIMYAFANLNADGSLNLSSAATNHFVTLNNLKTQNPNLKILLSVGGWTWSPNFSSVAADATKRATFANSCVQTVLAHNLDGIDVDWEWPGVAGGPGTTPSAADGPNYTLLLQALRTALDTEGDNQTPKKHYEISAFTAAGPAGIAVLELENLAPIFDFVNAQGYDLHGAWNSRTGHNAGLFHNPADPLDDRLNIDSILKQYLAGGFKRSQLLIGAPFYAQTFSNVPDTDNGLFQTSASTGGTKLYSALTTDLQNLPRHWDPIARVPYLYNPATKTWTSYDDPQSMHEKALYSRDQGFGGIFFWRNGGDNAQKHLLTTISDSLAFVDQDNDNIDDHWETSHFGDLTTASETTDTDNDGTTDFLEYKAKTNPNAASEKVDPPTFEPKTTGSEILFPTKAGVRYQVQTSTNLQANSWQNLGEIIEGTGNPITLSDTLHLPLSTHRFYRVTIVE